MKRGPEPAEERLRRLLAMLPWVMQHERVAVTDVATRFGITERQVIADLELATLVGRPPYSPDELVELVVDDDMVEVGPPRYFTKPLRLSPREGFALVATGRAALAVPGADVSGALSRAIDKVQASLGDAPVDVRLDRPDFLEFLQAAVDARQQVEIVYWSAWRDETARRRVDPWAVFSTQGRWYLAGFCHLADAPRRFRIDRVDEAALTGVDIVPRPYEAPTDTALDPTAEARLVTLRLPERHRWVVDSYPCRSVETHGEWITVELAVTTPRFLDRLLLRLGPEAVVVGPADLVDRGRAAASLVLRERYDPRPG